MSSHCYLPTKCFKGKIVVKLNYFEFWLLMDSYLGLQHRV